MEDGGVSDRRTAPPDGAETVVAVRANGPFDVLSAVRMLANHTIEGFDRLDPESAVYERRLRIADEVRTRIRLTPVGATVSVASEDRAVADEAARIVRFWFDLDTDVAAVDRHLASTPHLEDDVRRRPGVRITRYPDAFEAIVSIILGQGISLAAARTVMQRLVAITAASPSRTALPTAPDVLALEPDTLGGRLGIPARRAAALQAVAALFVDGYLPHEDGLDPLATIPGIGPWTVDTFALRAGLDGNAFPVGDAVLHRMLERKSARALGKAASAWTPHRGYAAMRLWTRDGDATGPRRPRG